LFFINEFRGFKRKWPKSRPLNFLDSSIAALCPLPFFGESGICSEIATIAAAKSRSAAIQTRISWSIIYKVKELWSISCLRSSFHVTPSAIEEVKRTTQKWRKSKMSVKSALSPLLWNLILRPCCLTALKAYRQRFS